MARPSRVLVVYFSVTEATRAIAHRIRDALGAEAEPIVEPNVPRTGPFGWLRSGVDAAMGNRPAILPPLHDPAEFDLVVIGTPVWNAAPAAPVRTYLVETRRHLPDVAFFCTHRGVGASRAFRAMASLGEQSPIVTLAVRRGEEDHELPDLDRFVAELATHRPRRAREVERIERWTH